jgi:hypothetical protein
MYKTELKHEPIPETLQKRIKIYSDLCIGLLKFDHARYRLLLNEDLRKTKAKRKEFINQYFNDTEKWVETNRLKLENYTSLDMSNDQSTLIKVWRWENAPKSYKILSENGGDEDWVAFIPNKIKEEYYSWMDEGTGFGCCTVKEYTINGGVVRIGSHA